MGTLDIRMSKLPELAEMKNIRPRSSVLSEAFRRCIHQLCALQRARVRLMYYLHAWGECSNGLDTRDPVGISEVLSLVERAEQLRVSYRITDFRGRPVRIEDLRKELERFKN